MLASDIDAELIRAYEETEYRILEGQPFTFHIGKVSHDLSQEHKRHRVECSALLTACNPLGQQFSEDTNRTRQRALVKELNIRSLSFLSGIGQHPTGLWRAEPSYLVFGLTLEAAKTLGARFEQNAIVWTGPDAVPQLILLR